MTRSQALWLAIIVAVLEVAFLQAGAQLTRGLAGPPNDQPSRSNAIAWLAAITVLLVIPFAAAGLLGLSSVTSMVRAAVVTSVGVLFASIAWFVIGQILGGANPQSPAAWTQLMWRTAGYGLLVVVTVRLLLGACVPVED